jgi:ELWxxDGT repeat protein
VVFRDTLFFQADDGLYGVELWKSDGTEGGTEMVMDIYPGSGKNGNYGSFPANFIVYKPAGAASDSLYFLARDGNGAELWVSGGSEDNTRMIKNIYTGSGGWGGANSSNPKYFAVSNGILFFNAASNNNGVELWKTDGTSAGTVIVKDINSGTGNSEPKFLMNMGTPGKLYFIANNGVAGEELWTSDGTAAGTVMVKDILAGSASSSIDNMIVWSNKLYFSADDGTNGSELWKSDGTTAGTVMVNDLNTGTASSYPDYLIGYKGALYFVANDGFSGFELWKTDGTAQTQVKDILLGSGNSSPYGLTISNNILYFAAQTASGNELWKTDGTTTAIVKDIYLGSKDSNPRDMIDFNNVLYFSADNGSNYPGFNREPWKTDGTNTSMVKDIVSGTKPATPSELTNINGIIYFSAESATNGNELYKTDGTAANTVIVKDILTGTYSSLPKHITNVNNTIFFSANDGNGYELWKSNGTTAGTAKIKSINGSGTGSDPDSFCAIGSTLYFTANDGSHGFELWKSDGTAAGTVLVKDIDTSHTLGVPNSSNPYGLINVNGKLFFRADDGINGTELWTSDGTANGTVMVKNINAGSKKSSDPMYFFSFKNECYFQADDGTNGVELWKSNGTAAGTVMVKNIYTGTGGWGTPNSSSPQQFCELGNYLYFQAAGNSVGRELWRTDGTDAGTTMVKDINTGTSGWGGANSSTPMYLTKVGADIYFAATTRNEGTELWKTDGTAAGTVMVRDINTRPRASSNPTNFYVIGNILYFVASDGIYGSELWKAENNLCGKVGMTGEINPGNAGTGPSNFANIASVLYFSASTADYGSELWKYTNQFSYADTGVLAYTICNGDSVKVNSKYYKVAGNFRDSLKTSKMCDSLILLNLKVNQSYKITSNIQKCIGDSVLIQGKQRKTAGTYTDSLNTIYGCDSIVEINLSFSPKPPRPTITLVGSIKMVSSSATGNQWYDDSGPISGATAQEYSTTKNAKFYVVVTIAGCSSDPSYSFNPRVGSINGDLLGEMNIYPNPVKDKLTIELKESKALGSIYYINNLEGQAVISGKLTETINEIDVSQIPRGIYFVKIIAGDKIGMIKFVRE